MSIINKLFKSSSKLSVDNLSLVPMNIRLPESFIIPEPTKSLLWITDEDISKLSSPHNIRITISITDDDVKSHIDDGHNFYGEPSLIWLRLPIQTNYELESEKMYFPSYSGLTPKQRYQYICWLRDITKETNLSYVFLYYYGLERNLLVGNFDAATSEIVKLLKYHDKGTFRSYAQDALIVSALHKKRFDVISRYDFIEDKISNEILLIRKGMGKDILPREIMSLASRVNFTKRHYLKSYPKEFEVELEKLVRNFKIINGSILDAVATADMESKISSVFANISLPDKTRTIRIPQPLTNEKFRTLLKSLLEQANNNLKLKKSAKSG